MDVTHEGLVESRVAAHVEVAAEDVALERLLFDLHHLPLAVLDGLRRLALSTGCIL